MNKYQNLQESYQEMNEYLLDLIEENKRMETELEYLRGFINYKSLDEEFVYFRKNAHEEQDPNFPFPYLTL